jgi:hypothetical protein
MVAAAGPALAAVRCQAPPFTPTGEVLFDHVKRDEGLSKSINNRCKTGLLSLGRGVEGVAQYRTLAGPDSTIESEGFRTQFRRLQKRW